MDINLELYKVFYMAAQEGSFSGAARALFISQPAVSQSIRQLEQVLGVRLFVRGARGTALTAEGKTLLGYTEAGLNLFRSGKQALESMRSLQGGELRIGAGDAITRRFLLTRIERFHAAHPQVALRVHNRTSAELVELLKSGGFDLAFVNLPLKDEALTILPCGDIHDIFVAAPQFASVPLQWEELATRPLIMLEPKSNSRRYVQEKFLRRGIELRPEIELGAYDLLMDFARIGLGIACVIEEFAQRELELGDVVKIPLCPQLPARQMGVCHLSAIEPSPAAQAFLQLLLPSGSCGEYSGDFGKSY